MKELRDHVMEEVMTFWKSRIILTGAELDLFTLLDESPATSERIASMLGCDPRGMDRLLNALSALGLLQKQDNGVCCLNEAGRFLSSRHPETILPMMLHFNGLWNGWSHLTDAVRTGGPAPRPHWEKDEPGRKAFIGAMHSIGLDLALEIADAFDASRFETLLDIGGASGTYTIAFLRKNPRLNAVLFDLAPVIQMARERLQAEGLDDRVMLVAGDFYKGDLPAGCDLALLSAIIHQNSPAQNLDLYKEIYQSLAPGGSLLIRDHIMDASRTKPPAGALFALNMLLGTRGGDTYTFDEVKDALEKAGFTEVKWLRSGERMDSLVEARKPG